MLGHKSAAMTLDQYGHLFNCMSCAVRDRCGGVFATSATASAPISSRSRMVCCADLQHLRPPDAQCTPDVR